MHVYVFISHDLIMKFHKRCASARPTPNAKMAEASCRSRRPTTASGTRTADEAEKSKARTMPRRSLCGQVCVELFPACHMIVSRHRKTFTCMQKKT